MRILVIGSRGNMGRRYCAIIKWLGYEVIEKDIGVNEASNVFDLSFDKAIIATPTNLHMEYCIDIGIRDRPFLCEKPVSKLLSDMKLLKTYSSGYMVNNWLYACEHHRINNIEYNFYNTGKDGILWDLIQPIYIARNSVTINPAHPIFEVWADNQRITLDAICESYVDMVSDFVEGVYENLWTMEDAYKATEKVLTWKGIKYVGTNSGADK